LQRHANNARPGSADPFFPWPLWPLPNALLSRPHLADNHSDNGVEHNSRIIEFADAFGYLGIILLNDYKIEPGLLPFVRLGAVKQMNEQAQKDKDAQENARFRQAKQAPVSRQKAQKDKDFGKLVPFGLQGM